MVHFILGSITFQNLILTTLYLRKISENINLKAFCQKAFLKIVSSYEKDVVLNGFEQK